MPRRLRQRLIQASILAVVVAAGYGAYTRITRPDPQMLARLAMKQLHDIFGPHVTTGPMDVDLIDGVIIPRLEVRNPAWPGGPTLSARWVKIEHDVVALASGAYVPTWIHIQDATIWTVETEDGIRLAFPFELEAPGRGGTIPRLDLDGGSIHLKPRPGSPHLRASPPIVLGDLEVHVRPEPTGRVRIEGSFTPVDLGHDDVTVEVTGWADPDAHRLELGAVWRPLRVNDALLAALSPQLAAQLGDLGIDEGALTVSLTREPRAGEGEIEVSARFEGTVVEPPQKLPGGILVDARTREQVAEVFQRARIDLRLSERGIDIGRLAPELPEGSIEATGFIADDGRTVDLMVVFKGVRFQDETIRKVLGPEGELVYDEFEPRGVIDVTLHIRKEPGSEISWDAYATIDDGAFRYVGTRNAEGQPQGFPYEMSQVSGVIYFQKDLVQFEDIVGFNGGATVRILSHRDHAWTGGETGRIKLTDAGPDIRITVEAVDVPVDATLQEAIEGSEVGPLLDRFEVEGILDRVLVDVIRDPLRDEGAPAQVRVEFSNERFRYLDFPLVLDDVTGVATMTRPPLPEGGRGHRVTVDVAGEADGAPVSVRADVDLLHKRGRLRVEATNVPLEGEVAQTINTAPLTREGIASVWRYLDPRGRADVLADLPLEDDPDPLQLKIRLLGAAVRLDAEEAELPLVVTDLDGVIAVSGDVVTLEDLRGKLGDDPVRIDGTIRGGTEGEWDLTVKTERLRLDLDLLRRLPHYLGEEHLLPGGLELESGGHLALTLRLRRQAGPGETLHAEVETREVDARLRLPQGSTLALRGKRLAVVGGDVTIEGMRGEAPGIVVKVDTLTAGDGPLVGSFDLVLDEFRTAKGILALAPESTRAFLGQWLESRVLSTEGIHVRTRPDGSVRVDGPLGVLAPEGATEDGSPRGELVFDGLVVESPGGDAPPWMHGRIAFHGLDPGDDLPVEELDGDAMIRRLVLGDAPSGSFTVRASRARLFGVRAAGLVVPVEWADGILRAGPLRGTLAGGAISGRLIAHTRAPPAYEGTLRLDDFDVAMLKEDLAPEGPAFTGRGSGWIRFENRGGSADDLLAQGQMRIRDGDLGELPGVANLQALLASLLQAPSRPRFERAYADFVLEKEVITFHRLHLAGPLFDMPGRGTVALDGTADLVFTPQILKSLLLPGSMQFPGVGPVLGAVLPEQVLYAVRIRGDLGRARPRLEPLPALGLSRGDDEFEGMGLPEPPARRIPHWFR